MSEGKCGRVTPLQQSHPLLIPMALPFCPFFGTRRTLLFFVLFFFAVDNFMSDDPYQRWPFSSNTFLVWPQMLMVIISMLASSTIWFLPLQQWFRKLLWIFKFQPYTELSRRLVLSYRLFPALQNVTALEFCSIFHEISNLAGLDKRWKIKNWWSVG